jgi:FkbM family methyltransferase
MVEQQDITLLYKILLNREPDPQGLEAYYKYAIEQKIDNVHELAIIMAKSEEFSQIHRSDLDTTWKHYGDIRYQDVDFKLPTNDFTYRELAFSGSYEPYVSSHMFSRLSDVSVFVDVGANLGLFALPVAKKVTPGGHVYAFEASYRNANLLQQNVWRNSLNNVTVYPIGLSNANGCAYSINSSHTSNTALFEGGNQGKNIELIPVVRLDSFWDKNIRIDMIKLDIEGYESKFMEGAAQTIVKDHPVIYLEYSDLFQRHGSGVPGEVLLSKLIDFGYSFEILHRTRSPEQVAGSKSEVIGRIDNALADHIRADRGSHLDLYLERKPIPQRGRPAGAEQRTSGGGG